MHNIIVSEFSTEYKLKAVKNESFELNKIVNNHNQSELILRSLYDGSIMIYESFFVLFLDNSLRVKGFLKVSQGGLTQTSVDVRMIFNAALNCLATALIISHNHPSGKLEPSQADIRITQKIKEGCEILDINLIDHIIITEFDSYSFLENKIL
ncbi:JAB domain-containing protein [Empedobacter falsenii]